jgi:eukaryotic-like serine/threonine-protein kinase
VDVDTRTEGAVLTDRYVLEKPLGSGGAGVVWRATDRLLQRPVAVKLLHPELAHDPATAARFRTEASSAAKLTHPNAVTIYDISRDGNRDFIVMELVDGPDLADLIADGPLAPDTVAHLGVAIGSALGLAHRRGMLHRDVKPANVLLDAAGVPKVADFGIARALGEATARLTAPGSVMGTARYLAPEQLLDGPLDGRVDVYALGLVLHEALTGQAPWGSGTALEIATRRLSRDLRPPSTLRSDVPPGLDAVIQRATRREADERYDDGAALAAALTPWGGDAGRWNLDRRLQNLIVVPRKPTSDRVDPVDHADPATRVAPATYPARAHAPERVSAPVGSPPAAPAHARPSPVAARDTAPPDPHPAAQPTMRASTRPRPSREGRRASVDRSRRKAGRRPPRARRRRRRPLRLLVMMLLLTGIVLAGLQLSVPGMSELTETVQDVDVENLLRDVRRRLTGG